MASIVDELVSYGSEFDILDDEQAARSVVVTNIPEEAREEDIIIHFQKRKHGGGDIDRLHIIENTTTAVVTFDSDEVARLVLQKPQRLKDTELELKPYPKLPAELPKVFSLVSARIEPDVCGVSPCVLREYLEKVEAEMSNMKHHEGSHFFIVSGTFEEIRQYRELLQTFLIKADLAGRHGDEVNPLNNPEESENIVENLEVVPRFMKLLQRAYKDRLHAIELHSLVELVWHEGSHKLEIKRRPGCSDRQYKEGVDSFINLYQQLYPSMVQDAVELHAEDAPYIERAASKIMEKLPVFIERSNDKCLVYGESSVIPRAVKQLKEELGLTARSGRRSIRPRDEKDIPSSNKDSLQRSNPKSSRESAASLGPLQHTMSNGVTITVLQGDITLQRVDAIVNAANENLAHGAGVAGAIVKNGGFQIQEESRRIISHQGRVPVGTVAYTSAGNLPCKFVIHAVGPRWGGQNNENDILLLRSACIRSLRLAASLQMTSIALPAISSGIFGMPKELCAQTMFDAVHEFDQSVECMLSTLRDVQFVNIDYETVMVFKKEFLNRYDSSNGSSIGRNPIASAPEMSRDSLGPINANKPLTSERGSQTTVRLTIDKPGHAKRRVDHQNIMEESDQKWTSKTPEADGRPVSSNNASMNPEKCSHGTRSGVKNGMPTSSRDDSSCNEGTTNAEFGGKTTDDSTNSGNDPVVVTTVNTRASAPSALNSGSNGPGTQGGSATATKAGETSKIGGNRPSDRRPNASPGGISGRPMKSAAGRGRAITLAQKDVRLPPGLFPEQFNSTSKDQERKQHDKLNEHLPTPQNAEGAPREQSGQRVGAVKATGPPGGKEDENVTSVTILPLPGDTKKNGELENQIDGHSDGDIHQLRQENKDRSSETPKPDEHQASSNDAPHNSKGSNRMTTSDGPSWKGSNSDRRDSDGSKGKGDAYFGNHREGDGISKPKDTEPTDFVTTTGSEEDCSLLTLPNAYNTPLPEETDEEAFHDALDEPPPLADEYSDQMAGQTENKPSDHDIHTDDELSSQNKSTDGTSEASEGSDDRKPDLPTEGITAMKSSSGGGYETRRPDEMTRCYVCFGTSENPKTLPNCGHKFCGGCIEQAFKAREGCPVCAFQRGSRVDADQPLGYMGWKVDKLSLPGFENCDTIVINYDIPDGIQGNEHPNPGKPYVGVLRKAYLPDNADGQEVLGLLKQAFNSRLVFTLNKRPTEEGKNLVIWNIIHHKANISGGPTNNGYPDTEYLRRVKQELAALGITKVT